MGDFNADGNSDLAVANSSSSYTSSGINIGILLGDGAGEFAAAVTYASGGSYPNSVIVGDFNGDGQSDLVVANSDGNNVGVLLGNGAGGFAAAMTYGSGGSGPYAVIMGDFDGDGNSDLAVANSDSNNVGVLLGNGAGGFAAAVAYASGGSSPSSVTVGDFNGDGRSDLAVANKNDVPPFNSPPLNRKNIGVLLGDGAGGFAAAVTYASGGSSPSSVSVGDFNGDGRSDLAVANENKPPLFNIKNVGVLLGNGDGGFAAPVTYASGGFGPTAIRVGDFNADGNSDLAVANNNGVGVLLGNGAGGFGAATTYASGGSSPNSVSVGDFNADGNSDLAVANNNNVSVLLGNDVGGFTATLIYASGGSSSNSVSVGDFNSDGNSDLAVANWNNVSVLLGNGVGGFAAAVIYASGGSSPNSINVGDFNADGKGDLAVANSGDNNIGILLGNGTGGFAAAVTYASGGLSPKSVVVGDFDVDGNRDLVVANADSDNVSVLLGNGTGGFADAIAYSSGGLSPQSVTGGDFNGDGNSDLAIANADSDNIGVLLANGAGGFAAAVAYASGGSSPSSVTVGDFNGDGNSDLAVTNAASGNVGVLFGNGTGGFSVAVTYASGGWGPLSVSVGDFNADENSDLAVVNSGESNVGVLLGNDTGGFAAVVTYASGGSYPRSVTVGDFNTDGKSDIAIANADGDSVEVLLGEEQYRPGVFEFDSPHAIRFGVQARGFGAGQLVEGTGNAFDGAGRLEVGGQTYAPSASSDFLTDNDRTIVTPMVTIAGLYVSREITVPATGAQDFARTVDVLSNPTGEPITTTVRIVGNLGSDAATTVWQTSDGDTVIEPTDRWIGTDDADGSGSPAVVHYIHGPAGLVPASVRRTGDLGDNLEWTYNITVPAGQTVRLAHFTILADTRAAAEAAADALIGINGFGGQAAAFLAAAELNSLANFGFNQPPHVAMPLVAPTAYGRATLDWTVPANAFSDVDQGDTLTLSAARADSTPLPSWLAFDTVTGRFHGAPTKDDGGNFDIVVTATDSGGLSVGAPLTLRVVAHPWQNPVDRMNVDGQSGVHAIDVLLVINYINFNGAGLLPLPTASNVGLPAYLDVNGDDRVDPTDVLLVINAIDSLDGAAGEGESARSLVMDLRAELPQQVSLAAPETSTTGVPVVADRFSFTRESGEERRAVRRDLSGIDLGSAASRATRLATAKNAGQLRLRDEVLADARDLAWTPLDAILPDIAGEISGVWKPR
ncbi:MAG: FG-GAP-like repeat-containing protein [Planctomycetota bacterium]|nr:FG-GAP-like repeat-containing protein [Planctomycetota bacterium]